VSSISPAVSPAHDDLPIPPSILPQPRSYKKEEPFLFVPFGSTLSIPPPLVRERDLTQIERSPSATGTRFFLPSESRTVRCIVWKNGVQWGEKFFKAEDRKGKKILKQIMANRLPSGLASEGDPIDVDIEFRPSVNFNG
jgi:hypothetical protein